MNYNAVMYRQHTTLKEYTEIAEEFLRNTSKLCTPYHRKLFLSPESVGIVVRYLINSDEKYDPTKGAAISTYRYKGMMNAKFAIIKSWKKQQKSIEISDTEFAYCSAAQEKSPEELLINAEEELDKKNLIDKMLNSPVLTDAERRCMKMIYLDGLRKVDVAKQLKISPQAVYLFEKQSLQKLRLRYAANN